jgi:hypothetical protein
VRVCRYPKLPTRCKPSTKTMLVHPLNPHTWSPDLTRPRLHDYMMRAGRADWTAVLLPLVHKRPVMVNSVI